MTPPKTWSEKVAPYRAGLDLLALVILSLLLFYASFPTEFPSHSWRPAIVVFITAALFGIWAVIHDRKQYWHLFGFIVVLFLLFYYVVKWDDLEKNWQAGLAAFLFGALVGATEIGSRYRDEPLKTIISPYGLIYIVFNGVISLLALLLILHYKSVFPFVGDGKDKLKAAIVAGFGATLVMRSNIALLKTPDNKEVPIGPDLVIRILLQIIDTNVDRLRAVERQRILQFNFERLQGLGSFEDSFPFLFNSLLAFQNLDATLKTQLSSTFKDYKEAKAPEDVKRLALGFVFLTLVGEANFEAIVRRAVEIKKSTDAAAALSSAGNTPPANPPPPQNNQP